MECDKCESLIHALRDCEEIREICLLLWEGNVPRHFFDLDLAAWWKCGLTGWGRPNGETLFLIAA